MEYLYENFTFPPDQSFTIRSQFIELKKYAEFRCHVNYELTSIENCFGKRFIGDNIEEFKDSDLILIGSYLPHCWQYYKAVDPTIQPHATIIHFFPEFMGKELLNKPEATHLQELFRNATRGIRFSGATLTEAKMLMQQMLFTKGLHRVSLMLRLLDVLASSKSYKILATPGFNSVENSAYADKINLISEYIFKNFQNEISLPKVASLIHMTPAAFCRFFKLRTNRTLIDFVKEVRIGFAAKLLLEGKSNITEACYKSGYNSLSNFNKHFREIKRLSPSEFLKQYNDTNTKNE